MEKRNGTRISYLAKLHSLPQNGAGAWPLPELDEAGIESVHILSSFAQEAGSFGYNLKVTDPSLKKGRMGGTKAMRIRVE